MESRIDQLANANKETFAEPEPGFIEDFRPPKPLSRWIIIPVGILLLPIVLLCGAGSAALLFAAHGASKGIAIAIAVPMLLLTGWLGTLVIRLLFSLEQKDGGLVSPLGLRVIAVVFLMLPLGGLFTGYFIQKPVIATIQALAYVLTFFGLRRLATYREASHRGEASKPARPQRTTAVQKDGSSDFTVT
jgi:hypothetical protein